MSRMRYRNFAPDMIRRSFIVLCVTAALATLFAGAVSRYGPFMFSVPLNQRHWLVVHFYDARIRLFSIQSQSDSIYLRRSRNGPDLWVSNGKLKLDALPDPPLSNGSLMLQQDDGHFWAQFLMIGSRRDLPQGGRRWCTTFLLFERPSGISRGVVRLVRLPYWLVALVFLTPPAKHLVVIWRKRSRIRHGLCTNCAYDLRGLPEPRCPECGQLFQPQSTIDNQHSIIRP